MNLNTQSKDCFWITNSYCARLVTDNNYLESIEYTKFAVTYKNYFISVREAFAVYYKKIFSVPVIALCCCIKFRVPRTKQQIEADYQRRVITKKFREQLERIQNSQMDMIDLKAGN